MDPEAPLREGEVVVLRRREGDVTLVRLARGPQTLEGRGTLDLTQEIGHAPGGEIRWAGATYRLFRPDLSDLLLQVRRRAQIVLPKDALPIAYLAGLGPGSQVAEAGSGSGALTIVLAHFVGPEGRVYSFDRRADFLEVAQRNVAAAGLGSRVEFAVRDVGEGGFGPAHFDAVVLDLAEPWSAIPKAGETLRVGGRLVAYVPTYNQLETTVRALRSAGFEEVRAQETLERPIHVGEGGTRPEFEMLGHTGFLCAGRRVA